MKKSISVNRKSRGRPKKKGGVYPVSAVRLPPNLGADVDRWASAQDDKPTRSEAIRRLVEIGLTVKTKARPKGEEVKPRRDTKQRARELAGTAIDEMTDTAASSENQANRRRRLISGPEEFQKVRRDRSNRK
jgi:hypothetical protein